jgi:hypothetical protein
MARSLYQHPRSTQFRFTDLDDIGDMRRRRYRFVEQQGAVTEKSFFWRLPLIAKIIVCLMIAAAGLIVGSVWALVIGGLMTR